jgi:hypothetical protein
LTRPIGYLAGDAESVEAIQRGVDLAAQPAPLSARESSSRNGSLAIQAAAMSSAASAVSSLADNNCALGVGEPFSAT